MINSFNRFKSLLLKDFNLFIYEPTFLITFIFPIIYILLFKIIYTDMPKETVASLIINVNLIINGLSGGCLMLTCEKQSYTYKKLFFTKLHAWEIYLSKMIILIITIFISSAICSLIAVGNIGNPLVFTLDHLIISVFLISLGFTIGIICKDYKRTGFFIFPITMIFLISMLVQLSDNIVEISRPILYIPTYHFIYILQNSYQFKPLKYVEDNVIILAVYTLLSLILLFSAYHRKKYVHRKLN